MDEEALRLDLEERVGEAWGDVDMEGNGILDADEIAQVRWQSISPSRQFAAHFRQDSLRNSSAAARL
mgnify:CR=1 FL=1